MFRTRTKDSNLLLAHLFEDKDDFAWSIFAIAISNVSFKNTGNVLITLPKDFKNVQPNNYVYENMNLYKHPPIHHCCI